MSEKTGNCDDNFAKSFEEFEWLNQYAPCFEIESKEIEILKTPVEFYNCLKVNFKSKDYHLN